MHLLIKYQGFKNLQTPQFTIYVAPSDTIGAITTRLEKMTGVLADRVSVISGLVISDPSSSFKKLDKSVSVSDHGLRDGSTLLIFVPVSQEVATPPPEQPKSRAVCVGKAKYRSSASEPIKSGDIMTGVDDKTGKPTTKVLFNGVEYANALDWLAKAFNNSGRSCCVQFERSQAAVVVTPRPRRYVPPSANCPFERYM